MEDKKEKGLELKEKPLAINSVFWTMQKLGFTIMAVILLLAFLGMMGPGIFGNLVVKDSAETFTIHYQPFMRKHADSELTLEINADKLQNRNRFIRIWIDLHSLQKYLIKHISPKPYLQQIDNDKLILFFAVDDKATHLTLNFWLEPQYAGELQNKIGILNGPMLDFRQFIYP